MGEEAAAFPPSAFLKPRDTASSSSFTYLGFFKQPDSELNSSPTRYHFEELDESDVVWSSVKSSSSSSSAFDDAAAAAYDDDDDDDDDDENDDNVSTERFSSRSPSVNSVSSLPPASFSPTAHLRRSFVAESRGLSAVLLEDRLPQVLQRRQAASPLAVPGRRVEGTGARGGGGEFHHNRHQSMPVNIPAWPKWKKGTKAEILEEVEDREEVDEEDDMVPPHVIVARSHATTFSVFEGVGRTLKGRDLRRVRNAVLQKTGFLD